MYLIHTHESKTRVRTEEILVQKTGVARSAMPWGWGSEKHNFHPTISHTIDTCQEFQFSQSYQF